MFIASRGLRYYTAEEWKLQWLIFLHKKSVHYWIESHTIHDSLKLIGLIIALCPRFRKKLFQLSLNPVPVICISLVPFSTIPANTPFFSPFCCNHQWWLSKTCLILFRSIKQSYIYVFDKWPTKTRNKIEFQMYYNYSSYEKAIVDAYITMSTACAQLKHCKTSQW